MILDAIEELRAVVEDAYAKPDPVEQHYRIVQALEAVERAVIELAGVTPKQARAAVLDGQTVRMTVGTGAEDPIVRLWLEDGCIYSYVVAGWSAGILEPVCAAESDFLSDYLTGRHRLEVVE